LVAAAELLGRPFDVGDPLAPGDLGHVEPGGEPAFTDEQGLVAEPLELELRVFGEAGVRAAVPQADAHLEVTHRVDVGELQVSETGLLERRHDG
jgi:hypothetical protein